MILNRLNSLASSSSGLYRGLRTGALLAIWCAALSGWLLELAPIPLMALHLVAGAGGLTVIAAFLHRHWWPRRHGLARHANAPWGVAVVAVLTLLVLSGAALVIWTNLAWLRRLHAGSAVILLGVLTFHIAWRLRCGLSQARHNRQRTGMPLATRSQPRQVLMDRPLCRWLLSGALVALLLLLASGTSASILDQPQSGAVISIAHASLQGRSLPSAADCAVCHVDLIHQWRTSAHAHAATDSYYQALAAMFVQERGVEALRYCTACHAPIALMQGEVIRSTEASSVSEGEVAQGYAARSLGVHLAVSSLAAEGVSCVVCHRAVSASPARNATLGITASELSLPGGALSQLALRSAPAEHRRQVSSSILDQAALCGACHNLRSPEGVLLEPTYQEWLDSPYPEQGKTCQACHLPLVGAHLADSSGLTASAAHGGFPGAPSSLPGVATGADLLQQAAELGLQAVPDAGALRLTVTVTNTGAGHFLPTGADDLRQVWLEVSLLDEQGRLLWQSGGLDNFGELLPGTVRFHKVLGDAAGRPIDLHRFWVATQVLDDTRLAPLEARKFSLTIPLPAPLAGPMRLSARLRYRDVSASFAAFALERPVPDLAITEMAQQELEIIPPNLDLWR